MAQPITKLPPQNIEAEQSLLGALLIDKDAIVKISEILRPANFYRTDSHGVIFEAIQSLFERREPIDLVTVTEELKRKSVYDKIGGSAYLASLVNIVPTSAHIEHYAKIVKDHALRRGLIAETTNLIQRAYDEKESVEELLEAAEAGIFALSKDHLSRDFLPIKDALTESFDRLDELQKSSGKLRGVPTGFRDLDSKLAGMQNSNLLILASRPGQGKCLAFDSKIVNPDTGEVVTIEEYCLKQVKSIFTLNDDLKIKKSQISHFVDDGQKEVFAVKTATGREIEVTASHPFLTISGWKKLSELKVSGRIAIPRRIPIFGKLELEDYKIKILAYLIADGGLTSGCPRFTNTNLLIAADFIASAERFDNVITRYYDSSGKRAPSYEIVKKGFDKNNITRIFSTNFKLLIGEQKITQSYLAGYLSVSPSSISMWVNGQTIPSENKLLMLASYFEKPRQFFLPDNFFGFQAKNSVTLWLEELCLMGKNALEKRVPQIIFTLTKEKLALFLNRLFACDGSVFFSSRGMTISYASSSKELIYDIQHLLLRFGIISKVRVKNIKYKTERRRSFELEIRDSSDVITFCQEIGIFAKEGRILRALLLAKKRLAENNFTKDTLPLEVWEVILSEKGQISWKVLYQKMGLPLSHNIHVWKRRPKRSTILKIAHALNSQKLFDLATSDIFWDKVISITPKGRKQVYDLTIPETHNFLANDFFVHNTSMALNIAQYVAVSAGLPVGIFSLEMSQEELVDRLLIGQADIDAWKLKTGRLDEKDFDRLSLAMGELAEAPLFIDDTPGISLAEMRTKARRLQIEHGLKLLIVDYLQLIRGRNLENRVQEVSEISQGLKNLARELKIPVLTISQLSRAVEQRGTRKPQLADLRESGCLAGDTKLMRADTGELVAIKDLVGQTKIPIFSLGKNLKLEVKFISKVFSSGNKQLFELKTRSGRSIKASANHPFLTVDGWKRLDSLKNGMHIGLPRFITPVTTQALMSDNEIILLAHLIGDGCVLPRQPIHYTSADPDNIQIVSQTASRLFGIKPKLVKQNNWFHVYLPSPYHLARGKHNPIVEWFKQLNLERVRSYEKVIPDALFSCSTDKIRLFLHHLWSTDGNISWKKMSFRKPSAAIYYSTTSRVLAIQIQHLLLRLGIFSTLRIKPERTNHPSYQIHVQSSNTQLRFCKLVGSYGSRGKIAPLLISALEDIKSNPNLDIIPKQVWHTFVQIEKTSSGLGWREVSTLLRTSYCGSTLFKSGLSRSRTMRLAGALGSQTLNNLAQSDIYWDEIVSIVPLEIEDVFDATVPQTHNFIANDFIVHNSIEQDADVVMFIWREDPEKPEQVTLDIQKHRNGPTGDISLVFRAERTKFYGMERTRKGTSERKEGEKESKEVVAVPN